MAALFCLPAIAYVYTRSYVTSKSSVKVVPWDADTVNPSIFAVISLQPILDLELFPTIKCASIDLQTPLQVFGVNTLQPAGSTLRFKRSARELQPRLVEVVVEPVGTGHPDHHWCSVCDESESFLTLSYSLFAALAVSDVDTESQHTFRSTVH